MSGTKLLCSNRNLISLFHTGDMDYAEARFMNLTPGVVHNLPKAVGV